MAKLLDNVPVFVITFVAQQMNIVRDTEGSIVEGDEVWANLTIFLITMIHPTGEYQ